VHVGRQVLTWAHNVRNDVTAAEIARSGGATVLCSVSVDSGALSFSPTEQAAGAYHLALQLAQPIRSPDQGSHSHAFVPSYREPPYLSPFVRYAFGDNNLPGNAGGQHCAVVDTEQPGSRWHVVTQLRSSSDGRCPVPAFVALARADFRWPHHRTYALPRVNKEVERLCKNVLPVTSLTLPTGRVKIGDAHPDHPRKDSERAAAAHAAHPCELPGHSGAHVPIDMTVSPCTAVATPMGYFPVQLVRDGAGRVQVVLVRLLPPVPGEADEAELRPSREASVEA